ncbi:MAG: Gfo/Idh/MocA family protein [Candidatus Fervidibacter sp.]|uniref:Gfo/Idh/MocA family protein n=1 Tax=Candidatus Fervidibacter sp. TaxID=3100871 RepID=UPI00404B4EE5
MYRVGIVGLGRKASTIDDEAHLRWLTNYELPPTTHVSAYLANPQTQIVAVCARTKESIERFYQRTGLRDVRGYTDFREMFANEKLDIVSVCTHTDMKSQIVIAAAEAGVKGIICEKAMATSLEEADEMIATCEKSGAKLIVNHPRRYHPTYWRAKDLLESGAIGDLIRIHGTMWTWLLHNGTHLWDIMRYFAGDADWVCGWVRDDHPTDPGGYGLVHFRNGVIAFADVGGGQGFTLELHGLNGTIKIDTFHDGVQVEVYADVYPPDPQRPAYQFRPRYLLQHEYYPNLPRFTPPMQAALQDLIESIEQDRQPFSSGYDGRAALEIGIAFHASHRSGNIPVSLPLKDRKLRVVSR